MKMVVGLGNPGREYEQTRHNVGFEVIDLLVEKLALNQPASKNQGLIYENQRHTSQGWEKVLFVKPLTYMNRSGLTVQPLASFYKIAPEDILILCDDLNLPFGKLRLKGKGSAGGQNGLKDILNRLGTQEIPRLRLGIDRPKGGGDVSGYVLQKFRSHEQETADLMLHQAAHTVEIWLNEGLTAAMNQTN